MVFPSLGCHMCKRRHIKCDSVRPLCGRCRKARYPCTWDVNEEEALPFRNENAFAQGQPRRPRKVKGHSKVSMTLMTKSRPAISSALSFPMESHAVNYWVENFVFGINDLPGIGHEYSSYVLPYWTRAPPDSSLYLALLALAHAVFGRARGVNKSIEDANKFYSKTFTKVKAHVTDVATEDIDRLLLTIMLMGSFENVMWGLNPNNPRNSSSSSDETGSRFWQNVCHHKGAGGLLRLRQLSGMPRNLPLDRVVRRQLIRIVILRGRTIPDYLEGSGYEEEGPMRELDSLITRLAGLRAKSMHHFQKQISKMDSLANTHQEIADEAQELDSAFTAWSNAVPDDWKFSAMQTPTGLGSPTTDLLYDCPVHTYTSHGHAAIWNRYRAVRLVVNSIRIRSLSTLLHCQCSLMGPFVTGLQELCRTNMDSLANDLCGGILFFFNAHNSPIEDGAGVRSIGIRDRPIHTECEILPKMATLLAWPLTVAISTEGIPEPQRQWLLSRLKIVADTLGDAVLESIVEKGEFKF